LNIFAAAPEGNRRLTGRWATPRKPRFVTSQLSEINEQTNDISNEAIFYENAESAKKNYF
jgi:hypothetical protein